MGREGCRQEGGRRRPLCVASGGRARHAATHKRAKHRGGLPLRARVPRRRRVHGVRAWRHPYGAWLRGAWRHCTPELVMHCMPGSMGTRRRAACTHGAAHTCATSTPAPAPATCHRSHTCATQAPHAASAPPLWLLPLHTTGRYMASHSDTPPHPHLHCLPGSGAAGETQHTHAERRISSLTDSMGRDMVPQIAT